MSEGKVDRELLRRFWRGERSFECKVAIAAYCRERYRIQKGGLKTVDAERARQLLLWFDTATEAALSTSLSISICSRIRNGKVKTIRKTTEELILKAAA